MSGMSVAGARITMRSAPTGLPPSSSELPMNIPSQAKLLIAPATDRYIVQLTDPPLASYRGGVLGLAATSPATTAISQTRPVARRKNSNRSSAFVACKSTFTACIAPEFIPKRLRSSMKEIQVSGRYFTFRKNEVSSSVLYADFIKFANKEVSWWSNPGVSAYTYWLCS